VHIISKKVQRIVDETVPEFNRKLYFSKKFRDGLRQDFINLREFALKTIESTSVIKTLKESQDKLFAESFLDISNRYIKLCDKVEKLQKLYNQRGSFVLFKKAENYIFNNKTLRENKIREGNLLFENGLPTGRNKHAVLQKYIVNLDGYEKVDSGKYHMKQATFKKGYFHFWGKKKKYFIDFKFDRAINKKLIILRCKKNLRKK
jgi:hypothetical protein